MPSRFAFADVLQMSPSRRARPLGEQPQRIGIDAVFYAENPRRQRLRRVVVGDRNRALHQDRAGIGFRNDKMHGGAGNLHAGAQRLAVRIEAGNDGSSEG